MKNRRIPACLAAFLLAGSAGILQVSCAPTGSAAAPEKGGAPAASVSLPGGWSDLKVGMSQKEVYDLLGLPTRVERAGKTLTAFYRFGSVVFEGADGFGYNNKGVLRTWKAK